jgi:uncharacterized membrane protein YuzA (DUF378 family)
MNTTSSTANARVASMSATAPRIIGPVDWLALALMIVGSVNWGLVGVANLDLVAALFGTGSTLSRIVYALVGLAGLYGIAMALKLGSRNKA